MSNRLASYLKEVTGDVSTLGEPRRRSDAKADKSSELDFFAVRVPVLRRRVKEGFSFYGGDRRHMLEAWDYIWRKSNNYEVMSCAVLYYQLQGREVEADTFGVLSTWTTRLENWGHCDSLASVFANCCHNDQRRVIPFLLKLSRRRSEWERRTSAVALIHYTGRCAVYLPTGDAFSVLTNLLRDESRYVAKATAWVLREYAHAEPKETRKFILANVQSMSSTVTRFIRAEIPSLRASATTQR